MPYIILLTHGKWGEELVKGAEMICGEIENVYTFSLLPDQSIEDYTEQVEKVLEAAPIGSIIIADLFGGTTSNIASFISISYNILALSGLNIAMLIAADKLRTKYTGEKLGEEILKVSFDNCKNLNKELNKK